MMRWLLSACLLLACTKARTDNNAGAGSTPAPNIAASTPADATAAMAPSGGSAVLDASVPRADGAGRAITARDRGAEAYVTAEMLEDPTPISSNRSPGADLSNQLGGDRSPPKGGRSLVVVMRARALDSSSLDAGAMEYEYVVRGRADVKRCFETLRAKAPTARGEITLRFTVDTTGAVVRSEVTGFDAEVTKCVETAMPRWKFTAPNKPARFELVLDLVIG